MQKTIHKSISNLTAKKRKAFCALVPMVAIGVLAGILATAMVGQAENTYATDASGNGDLDFSISSEKSIGVTLSTTSVALQINPTASGQFGRSSMTVDVSTNNTTGYNLTMKANTATLTRSAKVNGTDYTINPLGANVTCSSESETSCAGWATANNNQWGYRIDGGSDTTLTDAAYYSSMSGAVSEAKVIKNTAAPANSSKTTVYFGSQLTNSIPTGSYEGVTLSFIATTNAVPLVIGDIEYLQDLYGITSADTTTLLASMTEGTAYQKIDKRDNTTYNIAKLKDGNIWFLDNLALDLVNVSLDNLKGNTNASDTTLGYLKNGGGTSPYTATGVKNGTNSSTWANSYEAPYISDSYKTTVPNNSSYGSGNHYVGIYYNYCAASAGSYCYGSSSSTGDASEDVCPSGWHMPTGDTAKGSYYYLFNTGYSGNKTMSDSGSLQYNLSTPLSGYFSSGSQYNQGSNGSFWSSTRLNNTNMRLLYVDATNVRPQDYYGRYYGGSVRCIFTGA